MDNLTHSLVGLLIGRTFPKDSVPYAVPLCVVGANIPDIDIVTLFDAATYITYHRHLTHAFVAIPVMAALAVWLVRGWQKLRGKQLGASYGKQWAAALMAAASHVVLDMTNSYGTPVWLPFSREPISWDLFFIIEPVLWVILLTAAFSRPKRLSAGIGLVSLVLFAVITTAFKLNVEHRLIGFTVAGHPAVELQLFPAPWTPWDWTGYVRTETGEYAFHWNGEEKTVTKFTSPDAQLVENLRRTRLGAAYLDFAQYPLIVNSEDGAVRLGDFRFVREGKAVFSCRFEIDEDGQLKQGKFEF